MKKRLQLLNKEIINVFLLILLVDMSIRFLIAPTNITLELVTIKVLSSFVLASFYPMIKSIYTMKIDSEYALFIILGTLVVASFTGGLMIDSLNLMKNSLSVPKEVILADVLEYSFILGMTLLLCIKSIILLLKSKFQ